MNMCNCEVIADMTAKKNPLVDTYQIVVLLYLVAMILHIHTLCQQKNWKPYLIYL